MNVYSMLNIRFSLKKNLLATTSDNRLFLVQPEVCHFQNSFNMCNLKINLKNNNKCLKDEIL